MIEPSKGRDDLEYRYHVSIETDALMTDGDQEKYAAQGDDGYTADPDYESPYPELDWVRVGRIGFARATVEEAWLHIRQHLGPYLMDADGTHFIHVGSVIYIGKKTCRSSVFVTHLAAVPREEWLQPVPTVENSVEG